MRPLYPSRIRQEYSAWLCHRHGRARARLGFGALAAQIVDGVPLRRYPASPRLDDKPQAPRPAFAVVPKVAGLRGVSRDRLGCNVTRSDVIAGALH